MPSNTPQVLSPIYGCGGLYCILKGPLSSVRIDNMLSELTMWWSSSESSFLLTHSVQMLLRAWFEYYYESLAELKPLNVYSSINRGCSVHGKLDLIVAFILSLWCSTHPSQQFESLNFLVPQEFLHICWKILNHRNVSQFSSTVFFTSMPRTVPSTILIHYDALV